MMRIVNQNTRAEARAGWIIGYLNLGTGSRFRNRAYLPSRAQ